MIAKDSYIVSELCAATTAETPTANSVDGQTKLLPLSYLTSSPPTRISSSHSPHSLNNPKIKPEDTKDWLRYYLAPSKNAHAAL